jgi:hypothetical protein
VGLNKYEQQYGSADVKEAVRRAIADGWVINSIAPNPKHNKSKELFALYKAGMPAGEYVRLAEAFNARKVTGIECLRWDLEHGHITLAPADGQIFLARLGAPNKKWERPEMLSSSFSSTGRAAFLPG